MRAFLDRFYLFCAIAAGLSMLAMVLLVSGQIGARFFAMNIPSSDDISGYLVAWASFFGLAYAMSKEEHIRVDLVLNFLGPKARFIIDLVVCFVGLCVIVVFSFYVFLLVKEAYDYGDFTQGQLAMPLWLFQLPYLFGVLALSVSVADRLIRLVTRKGEKL